MSVERIIEALKGLSQEERRQVLESLRIEHQVTIHTIESAWKIRAEAILEAIYSSPDLTQRGVRGVLAEAVFRTDVVPTLAGWQSIPFEGEQAYDLMLRDSTGDVRVQVKNQRRERQQPKVDARLTQATGSTVYVVETQRTRNGQAATESGDMEATRPYRFGEFDVLAVCLQPSSGNWSDFIYCASKRLVARPTDTKLLAVMQPVHLDGSRGWTRSLDVAAREARNK